MKVLDSIDTAIQALLVIPYFIRSKRKFLYRSKAERKQTKKDLVSKLSNLRRKIQQNLSKSK